jgi:hypothetical protein
MLRLLIGSTALVLVASPGGAASLIDTSTVSGHYSSSHFYTHYASGHYWSTVNKDNQAVLYSSPDGVTWTSQGAIFAFTFPADTNYFAVRYGGSRIIAMAFNSGDNTRYYREGALESTGSVTWSAAPAAAGPADAVDPDLNALIANGRPVMWRAGLNGNGSLWRGSALTSPTWAALPGVVPAHGLTSGFTAGALFQTRGADPNDLIVLRAFTQNSYSAGNHRLLALKWNDALGAYDGSWYNVSTLGGTLTEDATTEVLAGTDADVQRKFAAVSDFNGNLHAVYTNRNTRVSHYRKTAGFNNSWTRVTSDVLGGEGAAKVALSAGSNGVLLLFYEKNATQRDIWYRRFDGTSWGPETLVYPGAALGTDLRRALAPPEYVLDCPSALAFTTGTTPPFGVNFSLAGGCFTLSTSASGTQITVDTPEVKMVWDGAGQGGGGLHELYGKTEPNSGVSRSGSTAAYNVFSTQINDVDTGSTWHFEGYDAVGGDRAGGVELLETTRVRARLRQAHDYTPTIHLARDWSVYANPRLAIDETLVFDTTQDARGAQGLHPRADVACGTFYCAGISDETNRVWIATDDSGTSSDMLGIAYTTPFFGRAGAGYSWNNSLEGGTPNTWLARVHEGTEVSTPAGSHRRFYLVYPHLAGLTSGGTEWQPYANDYRTPSAITMLEGQRWLHASENTGGVDDFNEAELVYPLTLDPVDGLRFRIDGTASDPRRHPFLKIRQWRSLLAYPSVTLDGVSLTPSLDYVADVKPISRAHFAQGLTFYSTLQADTAVTTPAVGTGGVVANGNDFPAARHGNGARFDADGEYLQMPTAGNFNSAEGTIAFWYQPSYDYGAGLVSDDMGLVGYEIDTNNRWNIWHEPWAGGAGSGEGLYFEIRSAGVSFTTGLGAGPSFPVRWRANEWVHLRFAWKSDAVTPRLEIWIDGQLVSPAPVGSYAAPAAVPANLYIGDLETNGFTSNAQGRIDEFHIYSSADAPTAFARGGLTADPSEFLADTSKSFSLGFAAVTAQGRGEYAYFGADSTFRGLNVTLQIPGVWSTAGDLVWEYWNGTAWASLESGLGFADTTSHLTAHGSISWTGDPPGWAPYSVNGGPDLYYVRAHLAAGGAYATLPVEREIRTDVLLFQYCGNITSAAREFDFSAPVPTAVELLSFTALGEDSSVRLEWRTASELDNLGFHLYRSPSEAGPFERITANAIPGLGSSPVGASYTHLDSGLENGVTYFYWLEDIDTNGGTERHGPVSATPVLGTAPPPSDAVATHATYGDPLASSLRLWRLGDDGVVVELVTNGFTFEPLEDGTVRINAPDFIELMEEGKPSVPVRRTWIEALAGRKVELVSVKAQSLETFTGLTLQRSSAPEAVASPEGVVRTRRRGRFAEGRGRRDEGLYPSDLARVVSVGFQGDVKKALLELAPLRWNGATGELMLARRIEVRLSFRARDPEERRTIGARGRRDARKGRSGKTGVVARLRARERGLHALAYEELRFSRRSLASDELRLSRQGESVPFHLAPDAKRFGPGSTLYFASEGEAANPYGTEAVYELELGPGGDVMAEGAAPPSGEIVDRHWMRVEREENRYYQAGLLEADDLWFWDLLFAPVEKDYPFVVDSRAPIPFPSSLQVALHGASDFPAKLDHHVRLRVNGVLIHESTWDGKTPRILDAQVPADVLGEGVNLLSIENVGDTEAPYSMVFLDRFTFSYPRLPVAIDGTLQGLWDASGQAHVVGIGPEAHLLDVTDERPRWLNGAEISSDGSMRFSAEAGRRYWIVSDEAVLRPAVSGVPKRSLRRSSSGADYLVIGPSAFLKAAAPLMRLREEQGLRVRAIPIEDVYSEFGFGEATPEAVRDFIAHAYHEWRPPAVRYVLLLGDASYDYKDYLGTGVSSHVPSVPIKTSFLWTVSDPAYAAVNGDDLLPDLAIGRLPATTVAEARSMAEKIVAWERTSDRLGGEVVLVADDADAGGDFPAQAIHLATGPLASQPTRLIRLDELGASTTRGAILGAFDQAPAVVSYVGHGGIHLWANENILSTADVSSLTARDRQPLVLTMNCLNGYFHFPYFDALAEALVKAEGKGAIASFSPSGLSLNEPAHLYHQALLHELFDSGHARLGDAIFAAQEAYAETGALPELLSIYHLIGDPALRIR